MGSDPDHASKRGNARPPVDGLARTIQAGLDATLAAEAAAHEVPASDAGRNPFAHGGARYEIVGTIGQGGMGRVLEANDRQFGRIVALKELIGTPPTAALVQRFVIESLVTGNLEHPGIPAVYERGVRDGKPFYAMRKHSGRTLGDAMLDAPTLTERLKLLPVLVQVANTLGFAHERGVVHRDIKPENIIVGRHGQTVVLDWGIAKVRSLASSIDAVVANHAPGSSASPLTVHGAVIGTPAYMAPEQATGQIDEIDERTDVFAVGAILYQLLAGRAPYRGATAALTLSEAAEARYEPLARVAPRAPVSLRGICEKAMSRAPEDRYQSAAELAAALESFQANALVGQDSRVVGVITYMLSAVAVLVLLAFAALMTQTNSSFREQGVGAFGVVILTVFGVALSLADWRTRGRYALSTLAGALALATVLLGTANAMLGIETTLFYLLRSPALNDAARFRRLLMSGTFESLGGVVVACVLAAIQIVIWATARRAVTRANAVRQPTGSPG